MSCGDTRKNLLAVVLNGSESPVFGSKTVYDTDVPSSWGLHDGYLRVTW